MASPHLRFRISLNRNNLCIRSSSLSLLYPFLLPPPANEWQESPRECRSQQFLRNTLRDRPTLFFHTVSVAEWFVPFDPHVWQNKSLLRERLTHARHYLLAAPSRPRKRATFISPVRSRSSKSSARVSLLSRAPPTQSLKHFLPRTQTYPHTPNGSEISLVFVLVQEF